MIRLFFSGHLADLLAMASGFIAGTALVVYIIPQFSVGFVFVLWKMAEATVMPGDRAGKVLVHEGFHCQLHKRQNSRFRWRCWRKECRVPLVTNDFNLEAENPRIRILDHKDHMHDVEMRQINRAKVREDLKREDPTV